MKDVTAFQKAYFVLMCVMVFYLIVSEIRTWISGRQLKKDTANLMQKIAERPRDDT